MVEVEPAMVSFVTVKELRPLLAFSSLPRGRRDKETRNADAYGMFVAVAIFCHPAAAVVVVSASAPDSRTLAMSV
jgi:hypothetical protein